MNINESINLVAVFPPEKAGGTSCYTIKDNTGAVVQARTSTGVVDAGNGVYMVTHTFTEAFDGIVVWDIDGLYASEELNVSDRINDTISSRASQTSVDLIPTDTILTNVDLILKLLNN